MHRLEYAQFIPTTLEEAWSFFSNAYNLEKITPVDMGFKVLTRFESPEIYNGMVIDYIVKPMFGIPTSWRTKIEEVQQLKKFVDVQLKGPYKLWHHTHTFEEVSGGVLMKDVIVYKIPLGVIGKFLNKLIVASRIQSIFDYRKHQINQLFKAKNYAIGL